MSLKAVDCRLAEFDDATVAHTIIEPYFDLGVEQAKRFVQQQGFDPSKLDSVRLRVDAAMHDKERHFGGCRTDGKVLVLAPQIVDLPEPVLGAVMLHELGHAVDFLYPGVFTLQGRRLQVAQQDFRGQRNALNRAARWDERDKDTVEFTADAIAEAMSGRQIGYLGPCQIQALGARTPRPRGLR
jgi:hypothetical protein